MFYYANRLQAACTARFKFKNNPCFRLFTLLTGTQRAVAHIDSLPCQRNRACAGIEQYLSHKVFDGQTVGIVSFIYNQGVHHIHAVGPGPEIARSCYGRFGISLIAFDRQQIRGVQGLNLAVKHGAEGNICVEVAARAGIKTKTRVLPAGAYRKGVIR